MRPLKKLRLLLSATAIRLASGSVRRRRFPQDWRPCSEDGGEPYTLSMPGFPVTRLEGCLVASTRACRKEATTDLANGVSHDQTVADLRGILANLRGRHIKTVLCGFFYKHWDGIGRKLAATYHAIFVPGSTCYDPRHRGPDGLHMSEEGHQVVAARLARVLQPAA